MLQDFKGMGKSGVDVLAYSNMLRYFHDINITIFDLLVRVYKKFLKSHKVRVICHV